MSPIFWTGPESDEYDRLALTGQLPDEAFGVIDFAEAFGVCVEQPSRRERRAHRAHRLANDARASDVAGHRDHPWRNHE